MEKECTKCHQVLPATIEYFKFDKRKKDHLTYWCRNCYKEKNKERYNNLSTEKKEKEKERLKEFRIKNRDTILNQRRERHRNKVQNDPKYLITNRLRNRLRNAFIRFSQNGKVSPAREYEIDYQAIFHHIGPCPGKRDEWHIDHIQPLCSFNFDDPEQIKKAFAPENHQWLPATENVKKGNRR